jgi:hypothetical protein
MYVLLLAIVLCGQSFLSSVVHNMLLVISYYMFKMSMNSFVECMFEQLYVCEGRYAVNVLTMRRRVQLPPPSSLANCI